MTEVLRLRSKGQGGRGVPLARHPGPLRVQLLPRAAARAWQVELTARGDEQLIELMNAGEADALGALFDRYQARAYRVARSICRDHDGAEEAIQEAFISVWRGRALYSAERGEVSAWLFSVVRNRSIDVVRCRQRHVRRRAGDDLLSTRAAPGDLAGEVVERVCAEKDLRRRLAELPDPQREVITLAYYGQLTCTEIADRIQIPVGTVKGRLRLGLDKLRNQLGAIEVSSAGCAPRSSCATARRPGASSAASS